MKNEYNVVRLLFWKFLQIALNASNDSSFYVLYYLLSRLVNCSDRLLRLASFAGRHAARSRIDSVPPNVRRLWASYHSLHARAFGNDRKSIRYDVIRACAGNVPNHVFALCSRSPDVVSTIRR